MQRARMTLVVVACALAAAIVAPAALGATPQQIYGDYARDGRLDQRYSAADLRRALGNAALQGYPRVGFKGAVEQALGAQAVQTRGGLPFTGLDLALIGAGGAVLLVSGATLVRLGRARK
ncbi:MAG TPA: hypothetical protein VLD16_04910, partial [Gaiellaceae bacterium]|nr:hypothetical protein [Gaiellaceae bacterium]